MERSRARETIEVMNLNANYSVSRSASPRFCLYVARYFVDGYKLFLCKLTPNVYNCLEQYIHVYKYSHTGTPCNVQIANEFQFRYN